MSKGEQATAGQRGSPEALHSRVEEAASQLVLGKLSGKQRTTVLRAIRTEAKAAGIAEVASIASAMLDEMARTKGTGAIETLLSNGLEQMQKALSDASSPSGCESVSDAAGASFTSVQAEAPASVPLGEDRELLGDFILESRDHLAQVEAQMITLEKAPEDTEAINTVFRAFHTIKGLAGFMDLAEMREIAHETESLLDLVRNHKQTITPAVVDIVLAATDYLQAWLVRIERTLAGGEAGLAPEKQELLERIGDAARGGANQASQVAETRLPDRGTPDEPVDRRREFSESWTGPERRSGMERRTDSADTRSVKVDTEKLDHLVDMAGELVIAQTMVVHNPELAALRSPALQHRLAQLERITGDLQRMAMAMRMVPIGGLFQRMNRLERDLARKTGKQAEMVATGAETELDRNVVEELADPLMHMIRNAIDHGLETPEERSAAGKDPTGKIRLSAFHQAGHIVIEIGDDGQGLNRDKILERARRAGMVEEGARPPDEEVFNLIFHPGFSTAEKITEVSGRGVGMDVVKRQIQKLRGRIGIESVVGKGTVFSLRLPLTLAMIDGLIVGVGRERYVVPIFSVREMLRPTAEMVFTVEGRQEMALVRNNLFPVVRLSRRFGVEPRSEAVTNNLLIVAEAGGKCFGLMVDELIGKQEVVIKGLGETLKEVPGVAGGAILGDGRVGLILDLEGIFHGGMRREIQ